ncbi:uncharacterized protein LOC142985374 [Anticarsia gemmatalis]|uniref:uncharacterized protein LOC142985374 n=1 Tax=Anticarsia gemmatalis TaxID=129554 RepID=UPI003F772E6B
MLLFYLILIISSVNCGYRRKDLEKTNTTKPHFRQPQNKLAVMFAEILDRIKLSKDLIVCMREDNCPSHEEVQRDDNDDIPTKPLRPEKNTSELLYYFISTKARRPDIEVYAREMLPPPPTMLPPDPEPFIEELKTDMTRSNGGYITVSFTRLCQLVALNNKQHVDDILRHSENIVTDMLAQNRLQWLGEPMGSILTNIVRGVSTMPSNLIESYAIMMSFMMEHRQESFSRAVNQVIDSADQYVSEDDGRQLFRAVQMFKEYPKDKFSDEVARTVIEAFEAAFDVPARTVERKQLMDRANKLCRERFPNRKWFKRVIEIGKNTTSTVSTTTTTMTPTVTVDDKTKLKRYLRRSLRNYNSKRAMTLF